MNKRVSFGVLWDWNGTLVDDVWLFVDVLNSLLSKKNLPLISEKYYVDNFVFPIDLFYKKLNLYRNKDFYRDVCDEFVFLYEQKFLLPTLHRKMRGVLGSLQKLNLHQFVLSASNNKHLKGAVEHYNLNPFFCDVVGTNNFIAEGKVFLAKSFIKKYSYINNWVVVGDTFLDADVAASINATFLFVDWGHTSKKRISSAGFVPFSYPDDVLRSLVLLFQKVN